MSVGLSDNYLSDSSDCYFHYSSKYYSIDDIKKSTERSAEEMSVESIGSAGDRSQKEELSRPVIVPSIEPQIAVPQVCKENVVNEASLENIKVSRMAENYLGKRRKVAGRKLVDPGMEPKLLTWIQDYTRKYKRFPARSLIKQVGKVLNKVKNFKASKGWLDKFMKRNGTFLARFRSSEGATPACEAKIMFKPEKNYPEHLLHMKLRRKRVVLANEIIRTESSEYKEQGWTNIASNDISTTHLGISVKKLKLN